MAYFFPHISTFSFAPKQNENFLYKSPPCLYTKTCNKYITVLFIRTTGSFAGYLPVLSAKSFLQVMADSFRLSELFPKTIACNTKKLYTGGKFMAKRQKKQWFKRGVWWRKIRHRPLHQAGYSLRYPKNRKKRGASYDFFD